MMTTGEARQRLSEIRHSDISFEEKAHEALELGEQYLGADSGYLARTEAETDHWEAVVSTASQEGQFPPERELDLETTYSRRTIAENEPVTLHDAPAQGLEDDPALETYGIEFYHGTPLYIHGEPHGSLCFVAGNPRDEPFRSEETLFAGLIARMLEQELERRDHQTELTRRKNLVNVLDRVLRHNIRNDMAVIRGETRIMADQLGESHSAVTTLNKIDSLIELCDKAREVEEVVDQNHDRTRTNLGALVEDVVTDVTGEFSAVSVTVDIDADITAQVLPSFERAVRELVENAVKHGGERPSVTVTAEQCPETVEFQISDTGPGLPDQEREVLTSGVETPLVHGSGLGLWLVHWIVASHDGTVEATVTDTGTVMSVSFPRVPAADDTQDLADLTQATDQYQAGFEESFDPQLLLDDQARIIEANPEAATIYGLEQAELRGRPLTEFVPGEFDFDSVWTTFQGSGRNCEVVTVSGADGQDKRVEYSATTDVVPGQHLLIARDVTEREQRRATLERYETVLNCINEMVWVYDESKQVTFVNQTSLDASPLSPDRLIGTPLAALEELFADPEAFEAWEALVEDVLAGTVVGGEQDVTLDVQGDPLVLHMRVTPVPDSDDPTGVVVVASDITERKERQQARDIEHSRADALFEQLGEPIVEVAFDDGTPVIDSMNGAFERTFCTADDQVVGKNLNEVLVPESEHSTARSISPRVEADEVVEAELELPTAAGERTFVLRTVPYSLGGPPRAYGIYVDITERKRRKEQFQAFIEQSTDIISVLDPDGTYQYQSPSAGRIVGRDAGDVIGDDAFEFVHPDHRERVKATFSEAMSNPETNPTAEYKFLHGDGSWTWLESIGNNQLDNPAIEGLVINSRDISERKERERRIQRERDRLDKFAGIVSHDLRNPLNVAQSRLELAQDACGNEHLDHVERAHDRMEQLIGDVLSLARAGEAIGETDVVDLATLVETCWQNVETGTADLVGETESSVRADRNQLKQLLENLLRNAVEHGGDDVTITTGDVPGGIYVEDDGAGIPESERSAVLEPGYSTSEAGTGFGLSIVRDVAEAHGWTITVTESAEGGARFELSDIQTD